MNRSLLTLLLLIFFSIASIAQDDGFIYPMGISEGDEELLATMPQKAVLTRSFYDTANLPESFSLKDYSPYPESQQSYGTCTAWAVSYAARTIVEAKAQGWTDREYITKNAFTPAFTYRVIEPDKKNCWGAYTLSAVASLKDIGALPLSYWNNDMDSSEFHCPERLGESLFDVADDYKINDFARLFFDEDYDRSKTERVKLSLSNENPVVISMFCPRSFHRVAGNLWEPEEDPKYGNHGRHAMTVVGYNDNKYGGAFEIQNSWGGDYAGNGYVWVKYEDFNKFVYAAIELINIPSPEPETALYDGGMTVFNINSETDFSVTYSDGEFPSFQVNEPITAGDRIRFYLENRETAYVYALGTGSVDTSVLPLFPSEGEIALLNYSENIVPLPSEDYYLEADNTVGENYIVLLYSKQELDVKSMSAELSGMQGNDIREKLRMKYSERLVPDSKIKIEKEKIKFEVFENDPDKLLAVVITFKHI